MAYLAAILDYRVLVFSIISAVFDITSSVQKDCFVSSTITVLNSHRVDTSATEMKPKLDDNVSQQVG